MKSEGAGDFRWGPVNEATQRAPVIRGRIFLCFENGRRGRVDGFFIQLVISEFHAGDVNSDIERAAACNRIQNNGAARLLEETAPNRNTAQVINLELRVSVIRIDGVSDRGGRSEPGNG